MALTSPGVQVTVVDESNYLPAATNSVPYILIATAQDKISGTGVGVAAGTLEANANRLYLVTSQRDLAATFGNPFFYKTAAGTPINGYELNEYGLLAAYSVLGISNRAYVQRANIDLTELNATLVRPTGAPADGTYWLDTAQTAWGIFEWNQTTGVFTVKTPIVITDTTQGDPVPSQDVGSIGDYAVNTTNVANPTYYKNSLNQWILVGAEGWKTSWPTILGTESVPGATLNSGDVIIINGTTVTVPVGETLESLADAIDSAAIPGVTALVDSGSHLQILADTDAEADGSSGDGGLVVISTASTPALLSAIGIVADTYATPTLLQSYSYQVPRWRSTDTTPRPTGSVWVQMNAVNQGANLIVNRFDTALDAFVTINTPLFLTPEAMIYGIDPVNGGKNIPTGTLWGEVNSESVFVNTMWEPTATTKLFRFFASGQTIVTGSTTTPTFTVSETFTLQASAAGSATLSGAVTVTIGGTGTAADFVTAVSAVAVPYVSAVVDSNGSISFIHSQGGVIYVNDIIGSPITDAGFNTSTDGVSAAKTEGLYLTNFDALVYTASATAPSIDPVEGRKWYYSATNQVDIMILNDGAWCGYRTVSNDMRGYNLSLTDPAGPIISPTQPTTQSDNTVVVYGDLWINTSNLESYPIINRWENVNGVDQWVTIVNSDQTTSNGVLFEDARWAPNGTTDPVTAAYPTIVSLLSSNYTDLDAPSVDLYPEGMLLWNTRRSGFNVKAFRSDYFNGLDFTVDSYGATTSYLVNDKVLYNGVIYVCIQNSTGNGPNNTAYWSVLETNAWVTVSGNQNDGSPYMGRKAVRQVVVAALKSGIDTQIQLREEQNVFNLIACPQYPELIPNMVALNNERSNTAFIIGDTPLRLGPDANGIVTWATNANGLGAGGEDGITVSDPYLGVFYPSCQTTDLAGTTVVQPPSHMMLRTIVRSDEVAYPWLAPAGVRRGLVDNADRIGYVNSITGEFVTIAAGQTLRDVLYENKINPITFIPGVGIANYGNKTEAAVATAMDRINVARLVSYVRARLTEIGKTFVFEPNDQITRNEISNAIQSLMIDLIAKRGIYDYLVVCDASNNTPARIDRNELYVDIAIEPVKAIEFIYIPLRIKNTGEISSGNVPPSQAT
jgi:hypothetical protein